MLGCHPLLYLRAIAWGNEMKLQNRILKAVVLFIAVLFIAGCGGAEQGKSKYLANGKDYL